MKRGVAQRIKNLLHLQDHRECPVCGSEKLEVTNNVSSHDVVITQEMFCKECGAIWDDLYKLIGVSYLRDNDGLEMEETVIDGVDSLIDNEMKKTLDENIYDLPTLIGLRDDLDKLIEERMRNGC